MTRISFPFPVLGSDDSVTTTTVLGNVRTYPTPRVAEVEFDIKNNDPDFVRLLREKKASLFVKWISPATMSVGYMPLPQKRATSNGLTCNCVFEQSDVSGEVELEVLFVALEDLDNFRWKHTHPEFGSATWSVSRGEVLGYLGSRIINATKAYDVLNKPLADIWRFQERRGQFVDIDVDDSNDQYAVVYLSSKIFELFCTLHNSPRIQSSVVLLPALMQIVANLQEDLSEIDVDDVSKLNEILSPWKVSLCVQMIALAGEKVLEMQPLEISQRLLAGKSGVAFDALDQVLGMEENSDDCFSEEIVN